MKHQYYFLTILFILVATFSQAQEFADKDYYLIDSLVLEDLSGSDRILIDSMLHLYHNTDIDTLKLSHLDILIEKFSDDNIWSSYNEILFNDAKHLSEQQNLNEKEFQAYQGFLGVSNGNKAYPYVISGDNKNALIYYNLAVNHFTLAKDDKNQGVILNFLSVIYQREGDFVKAIESIERSIDLIKNKELSDNTMSCYFNMVTLQSNIGNYKDAEYYNEILLDIAKETLNKRMIGLSTLLSASFLTKQGDHLAAKEKVISANNILKNSDKTSDLLQVYRFWVEVEIKLENWEEAVRINNKLDSLSLELSVIFDIIRVKSNRLEIYFNTGNLAQAKKNGEDALKLLEDNKAESSKIVILEYLAQIAQIEGDYKLANKYLLDWSELKKMAFSDEIKNQGAKQVLQYKYDEQKEIDDLKSQQEIKLAEANQLIAEEKAQRNLSFLIAALAMIVLVGVIAAFLLYRAKQRKEQELLAVQLAERTKQFDLEKEVLVSRLKTLRSQMNPHFIFNLLNSIQHLVLKGDIENSYTFINQFAGLVRSTLDYSDREKIMVSEELQLLQVYLKLEKLRFNDNFEYQIIENNTEKEVMMPPMLIQPFIENALVHGLLHKEGMRQLKVTIEVKDVIICTIEDNGVGRKKAKEIRERQRGNHKSFSTAAIEKRFAILSEYYKEELGYTYYDLDEAEEMSTKVILRIPFDKIS